ncbi:hypothetical protein [Actinacidiphila guanduensis]|uniref:hypothetical protein n=1 Tax=Actinacidiphila guanduensis TaxID=310781 RepID=UPI00115FA96B|nr:hypothetical protein [Actinacidiphila guanduensis]
MAWALAVNSSAAASWENLVNDSLGKAHVQPEVCETRTTSLGGWLEWEESGRDRNRYFTVFGYGEPHQVEVRLDGWIFGSVTIETLGPLLSSFLAGGCSIARRIPFLSPWRMTIETPVGVFSTYDREFGGNPFAP